MLFVPSALSLARPSRRVVSAYFGGLTFLLTLCDPTGIIWLPVQFTLKDSLSFGPQALAIFEAIVLVPASLGFVWGWIRDQWTAWPFGDRGYLILGSALAVCVYLYLGRSDAISYVWLLAGLLVASLVFEIMLAVAEAMLTTVGQSFGMTGRLSAVDELAQVTGEVVALVAGGFLVQHFTGQVAFLAAAIAVAALLPLVILCPPSVSAGLAAPARTTAPDQAPARVAIRDRHLWLVVGLLAVWNFSPGWSTPLLYYLTSDIGLSPELYGIYRAVHFASMASAAVLYVYLCQRQPIGRILRWSIGASLPVGAPLLFITDPFQAIAVGAAAGLLIGLANVALFDLARRSCPRPIAGTGMALAFSAWALSSAVGDVAGAWAYEKVGLTACLGADAATNAVVLVLLARMPRLIRESQDV
jgi:hypothetical protein